MGIGTIDRSAIRLELRAMLEAADRSGGPPVEQLALAEARASSETGLPDLWGPGVPVATVRDFEIETGFTRLPARLYRPGNAVGTILFFHGGGWVMGSIGTHDGACRLLANLVPCDVLSVEYRKAPEHPFPAAVEDADWALVWLIANADKLGLDKQAIVVAGESSGANLAAVVARHARDRGVNLAGQLLVQPVTDLTMNSQSYRDFAVGFRLTAAGMAWCVRHYLNGSPPDDADASPLRAHDLSRLAPSFIITAECDPVRDEGRAYASHLILAGNDVTYVEPKGAIHGIWVMNAITPATGELIAAAADWLRLRWAQGK